ncbi:restriction endonuclease subunit S [Rhabdaerophilum sp. SD176]|uniref:restriction endonuclease subunit S n=1 Tax=Rhabdaerophilum sp. SD176 TaxID=2983548 RepID=UPI0024DF6831|nr:restriction endonuclease subunit S [Rhabdaerophilum sp. SD176]
MSSKVKSSAATGGEFLLPKLRFPEFQDASGWRITKLNSLLFEAKHRNRSLKLGPADVLSVSGEYGCVNQIEFMGRSYAGVTVKDYHVVEHGDIVYTKSPLKKNPYGIIKENKGKRGIVSTLYAVYRPFPECSATYLDHFFSVDFHLNAYLQPIVRKGAKNDMKVNNADVLKGDICVPTLPEQQKIADCLDSADALIAAQGRKVEALRAYKKGLMQQLFPQEGETQPRLRFREFEGTGEWKEVRLNTLGDLVSGLTYSPDDVQEEGLLVLRSSNIQSGKIDLKDCVYVDPNIKGANLSRPNDILVCVRNGSTSLIGKTALIPEGMPLCTHGAFMTVFRSKAPKFAFQLFQTSRYQKQVAGDLGATINSINGSQFLRYKFFVPKPPEQQRIADCLTSLDDLIAAEARKLDTLKTHKKGLMQLLFPSVGEADV